MANSELRRVVLRRLPLPVIAFCVSRIDHEKCIVATRVCVSICPRPHAYTIARTRV